MTLLWFDGFDNQDLSVYSVSTNVLATFTGTRFGTGTACARSSGSAEAFVKKSVTASSQIFVGGAFKVATTSTNFLAFAFYGDSGVTQHITVRFTAATKQIEILRGTTAGTVLASSSADVYAVGSHFYLEGSCTVADSGGVVEVRMNGNPTPIVSYTGDTKNAGTSTNIDAVSWGTCTNADLFDDVYVCNSSGSSPTNTFLGDVRVSTLVPTGAGASTGLTASTGSNWQTVDELPAVATDYSGSPTSGARDSYATADLPSGASAVYGVILNSYMHKSDAGASSMKPVLRVSSTNYYGATQVLNSTMTRYLDMWTASPATSSAWTVSEINGAEIGAEVV